MATLRLTSVNVLKTQGRGGAGSVGRGSRCRSRGKAALCAGMTSILHPSTETVKFPGGAYEFLVELAAGGAGWRSVGWNAVVEHKAQTHLRGFALVSRSIRASYLAAPMYF